MQIQLLDHFLGIVGRSLHGGTSCSQLTGYALTNRTIDQTSQILRNDGIKYFRRIRLIQNQIPDALCILFICQVLQRQHRNRRWLLGKHGNKLCVTKINVSKFSLLKFPAEQIRHLKAVCNRNIGNFAKAFCNTGKSISLRILLSLFPNGKNQEILIHRGCFQTFKQVGVISASQTTVSGDQHITALLIPGFSCIYRRKICIPLGNIHKGLMHGLKIGPADFRPFFCFTQFGGCYKFHCLGNLHGALHTFDPQLYRFHVCSHKKSSLSQFISQVLYLQNSQYTVPMRPSASLLSPQIMHLWNGFPALQQHPVHHCRSRYKDRLHSFLHPL